MPDDDPEPEIYVPHWPDLTAKKPQFWSDFERAQNEASLAAHKEWEERQAKEEPSDGLI